MSNIHPSIRANVMFTDIHYEICESNGIPESDSTLQCAKKICLICIEQIKDIKTVYHDADLYEYWEQVQSHIKAR